MKGRKSLHAGNSRQAQFPRDLQWRGQPEDDNHPNTCDGMGLTRAHDEMTSVMLAVCAEDAAAGPKNGCLLWTSAAVHLEQ